MSKVVCLTEYRGRKSVRERKEREYMTNLTEDVLHMIRNQYSVDKKEKHIELQK